MIDFDFHIHSNYSSCAKQTPRQLVEKAFSSGIRTIALTDHDCIEGNAECKKICEEYEVSFINGVEMSASTDENISSVIANTGVHILGYNIRLDYEAFDDGLKSKIERSYKRNINLVSYLNEIGYKIEICKDITEQQIKEQLVKKQYFADKKQAKSFLASSELAKRFPKERLSIKQTIDMIHSLGGIAVWAHPFNGENHIEFSRNQIENILSYMIKNSLDGLEVFHSSNSPASNMNFLLSLSKQNNIGITLGSDRHFCDDRYGQDYFSMINELSKIDFDYDLIKQYIVGGQ